MPRYTGSAMAVAPRQVGVERSRVVDPELVEGRAPRAIRPTGAVS
jgi:hypothetical protein